MFKGIPISFLSVAILLMVVLSACASDPPPVDSVSAVTGAVNGPGSPDAYEVVDCLLPGQIRQLGTRTTYVTERRPARTTKEDCVIRGGEYVAVDRADYQSALKVWLSEAQKGLADAQYYTATIYEKGQGTAPDYQQAAEWYRKAAEQNDKRAAIGLGRLYEQGLGVQKDPAQAFTWFAKASGLNDGALALLVHKQAPTAQATKRTRELEQALAGKDQEIKKLSGELRDVQKEVAALQTTVKERTSQMQQERTTLTQNEQRYQTLQADLALLRAQPDKTQQTAALGLQIQKLQAEITLEKNQLTNRNAEIVQLQARINGLERNADRIQVLEQTVARRDSEAQTLRAQVAAANQEFKRLEGQLLERQRLAADERRKSQDADQRYQAAQAQLEQLRTKPDQSAAVATYETTVKKLQEEMGRAKKEIEDRNSGVAQLQQKIASLEADAEKQAKELQASSINDIGFDGPSLEIIDPPLAKTRGVQVTKDELAIPVSTGTRRSVTGRVLAPAGLRTITVNGESMKVNDDGVFTATLPVLRSGADELAVQILAVDMQNKRAALKFFLKGRGTMVVSARATKQDTSGFGRYHALVIGNDHYKHWPQLMNAISDATAIAKVLKEQYGFQVTLLKDASRGQIMKALNQYRKVLTEKDNLLIYYAGHGHLEQGIDRGYWIPVDAEINDNSEWILLPGVTDMLQLISAKHVMVVADSCFGGKLTRSSLAQLKPGLTDDERFGLLKTLAQKRVRTAMTSGGVKPVLDAGGSGHSVFADAFLGVLEENATVLEAERLFWAVRTRVVSTSQKLNAEQVPTYDPIHMAGHESLGDFIFVPKAL
ncbi:MAG: caspase family protein [Nitrospirota bacterium]|nr:caspase family protein [Nitrospirota bacterium]MDP2384535.1 caspase family protein [Nitrospirota bacterium]